MTRDDKNRTTEGCNMTPKILKGLKDGLLYDYTISDPLFRDSKTHMGDLPVVVSSKEMADIWQYPHGTQCAFIYSIFSSREAGSYFLSQIYAKMAIYAGLSFIRNTDIRESGIPLFFVVSSLFAEDILPFMRVAGVPDENVIMLDHDHVLGNATKQVSMFVDELHHFDRVICIDTDLYFHLPDGTPPFPFFSNVLSCWDDSGADILIADGYSTDGYYRDWALEFVEQGIKTNRDGAWKYLESVSRPGMRSRYESPDALKPRHGGYICGYSSSIRKDPDLQDWFLTQAPIVWSDAHLVKLFLHKTGYPKVYARDSDPRNPPYRVYYEFTPNRNRPAVVHPRGNDADNPYDSWRDDWLKEMAVISDYGFGLNRGLY